MRERLEMFSSMNDLEALRELGCDTAQGHFVAPPLDREGLERWIAAR